MDLASMAFGLAEVEHWSSRRYVRAFFACDVFARSID
jgi:hypothetical protein